LPIPALASRWYHERPLDFAEISPSFHPSRQAICMSSRQTISFLRRRFAEVGISPATRYGQNFLIDLNLVELLAEAAELERRDVVLEVGTGTGSLTSLLAARAGAVVTVEIDPQLYQLAR